ncbi:hypothetical protein N9W72_05240 [Luminiphilus sp.]|nr:hypothetical protein [Luminiphilus sp.]
MRLQSLLTNSAFMVTSQVASLVTPLYVTIIASQYYTGIVFSANLIAISIASALFIFNDLGLYQLIIKKFIEVRNEQKLSSDLLSLIYSQRLLSVFISTALLALLPSIGDYSSITSYLIIVTFGMVSQAFQPIWVFQAFEDVRFYCVFNIISKLINLAVVTICIFSYENPYGPVLGFAISNFLLAISLNTFLQVSGYKVYLVNPMKVWGLVREGRNYTISRLSILTYTGLISFLVGINDIAAAGIVALAEQLYKAIQLSVSPIIQVIIPYCERVRDSKLVYKLLAGLIIILSISALIVGYFGSQAVLYLWGISSEHEVAILFVYFGAAGLNTISSLIGFPLFGAFGHYEKTNYSSIANGLFSLFIVTVAFVYFDQLLSSIILICEISLLTIRISHVGYIWSTKR